MRAERTDANQASIIADLRKMGYSVFVIGRPVDILVGAATPKGRRTFIFEVKDPDKVPSHRKLNKFQQVFFDTWRGQVDKIETSEEAIKIITDQNRGRR